MAKTQRLKSRRHSEAKKMDLAIKYRERGVATGEGRVTFKKNRHAIEARNIPVLREESSPSNKAKKDAGIIPAT